MVTLSLFVDGSTLAHFGEEGRDIRLSPSGTLFTSTCASSNDTTTSNSYHGTGTNVKQLTHLATSAFKQAVQKTLAFRNAYAEKPFVILDWLSAAERACCVETTTTIDAVRWPSPASCGLSSAVTTTSSSKQAKSSYRKPSPHRFQATSSASTASINATTAAFLSSTYTPQRDASPANKKGNSPSRSKPRSSHVLQLTSIDKNVRIMVPLHAQYFKVQYPVQVFSGNESETATTKTYVWIEQRWPTKQCPPMWQYPIELMRRILNLETSPFPAEVVHAATMQTNAHLAYALPQSQTDVALRTASLSISPIPKPAVVIWREGILYRFLDVPSSDAKATSPYEHEVMCLPDERVVLQTVQGGKYVIVYNQSDEEEGWMYLVDSVPDTWRDPVTQKTYPLSQLAHTALRLLHEQQIHHLSYQFVHKEGVAESIYQRGTQPRSASSGAPQKKGPIFQKTQSWTPLSRVKVPNLGDFTMYQDGRLRILFDDRVILEMPADEGQGRMVARNGTEHQFEHTKGALRNVTTHGASATAAAVADIESHVRAAMQFAGWARMAPDERAKSASEADAKMRDVRAAVNRTRYFLVREKGAKPPTEGTEENDRPTPAMVPRANPYARQSEPPQTQREENVAPPINDLPRLKTRTTQFLDDVESILSGLKLRVSSGEDTEAAPSATQPAIIES